MPLDDPRPSFIEELCLVLAHRWEPGRLFVIFTAYFDESDTHKPKPDVIMAAFLGTARDWREIEKGLTRLQQRYGFVIFHSKDFRARAGEFAGWSDAKRDDLLGDLIRLVGFGVPNALTARLPHDLYQQEYRSTPFPKGMHKDSQYGLCFRSCLHRLITLVESDQRDNRLNVVIEGGHKNANDTVRIFHEVKADYGFVGRHTLGAITVAAKTDAPPLMVADLQAHLWSTNERIRAAGEPGVQELNPRPEPGQTVLTNLLFSADYLRRLKADWQALKTLKMEHWRAERAARRASASAKRQPS